MQKRQYFLKPTIFGRSSPKLIGFLRKEEQIYMQNFKTIGSTSFELSRQKIDNKHTHTYTSIHFRDTIFFQCRLYINMKNGEIREWIFDTDWRLYSIKIWESKIYQLIVFLRGAAQGFEEVEWYKYYNSFYETHRTRFCLSCTFRYSRMFNYVNIEN